MSHYQPLHHPPLLSLRCESQLGGIVFRLRRCYIASGDSHFAA